MLFSLFRFARPGMPLCLLAEGRSEPLDERLELGRRQARFGMGQEIGAQRHLALLNRFGRLGSLFAKMLGRDPAAELREGLRRFKQVMETGEMATTDGQSAGHAGLAKLRK